MKSFTKILCLAIAVVMLVGLIGCSNGQSSQPAGSSSAVQGSSSTGDSSTVEGDGSWQPTHDYSDRLQLNVSNVGTIEGYDYSAGDGYAQYYSDKFNYDLEVTGTTYDNWNERMRVWINSGDMPEISVINYTSGTHNDFVNYIDQGLLKKLPDDWKTTWPNLAAAYGVTSLGPHAEELFGGTYFLPRPRFNENTPGDPLPDHLSIYIRADWAEAVGFEVKTAYKMSEIFEYLRLVKEQDPGNVGSALKLMVGNPAYATRAFVAMNSTHYSTFYRDASGKVQWGPASQDTLTGLKLFQDAYGEGLLDPEFYNYKIDEDIELLALQGIAAACFQPAPTGSIHSWRQRYVDSTGGNYEDIAVATLLGEDGYYHQEDLINFWGVIAFSPDIDDAKFMRWMDVLDYNATQEGIATTNLGIPEVDWTVDESGVYTSLLPEGQLLSGTTGKYPSIGYTIGISVLFDDFAFNNPNQPLVSRELSRTIYAERCEIATPETFTKVDWDIYTYSSPAQSKVAFDYGIEYSSLVTMGGDIEANWKSWVDSKMSIVQPVIEEMDAAFSN